MNWTWNVRSNDGAMNGLEFARCTTAGGFDRVLIHAAPALTRIEIIDGDDRVVARADLNRAGDYTPMTLIEVDGSTLRRREVWPAQEHHGPAAAGLSGVPGEIPAAFEILQVTEYGTAPLVLHLLYPGLRLRRQPGRAQSAGSCAQARLSLPSPPPGRRA